ncbi:MAG: hypothetical protein Q9213_005446 [Squamulea squamosa]
MGQKSSTVKMLGVKEWKTRQDKWLNNVSRGMSVPGLMKLHYPTKSARRSTEQVLQELTELYSKGNFDHGPASAAAELTQLITTADDQSDSIRVYVTKLLEIYHGNPVRNLKQSAEIMVKIWKYHAAYPFLPEATSNLDADGVLRAATFIIGEAYRFVGSGSKMNGQVLTRKKSEIDSRRMLFCSLAVAAPEHTDPDAGKEESKQEILDVLACIQPRLSAKMAPLSQQQLEPTASRLCEKQISLPSLVISLQDMRNLLEILIVGRVCIYLSFDMYGLEKTVQNILNSFLLGNNDVVRWETFNKVIEHLMPWIATGLQNLTSTTYAYQPSMDLPSPATSSSCRLYRMALPQLLTFLPKFVHKELNKPGMIYEHSISSTRPSRNVLQDLLDSLRENIRPLIVLVSFLVEEEEFVFGAFVPTTVHATKTVNEHADTARLLDKSLLFQLAPLQDVFPVRCKGTGLPPQSFHNFESAENGGLSFGRGRATDATMEGGVTLQIDGERLQKVTFVHALGSKGVYCPSTALGESRGNIRLECNVREIEVVAL